MPDIKVFDEHTNTLGKKAVNVKDCDTGLMFKYTKRNGAWNRGPPTRTVEGQVGNEMVLVNDDELVKAFDEVMKADGYKVNA